MSISPGHDEEPAAWVTVYWAQALEEAHIIRGALETEDIPVMLEGAESSGAYGSTALRGVRVWVPRALEDRARGVLEDLGQP
jgi:hypothetical protein